MQTGLNNLEGIVEEIKKNKEVEAIYLFGSHVKSRAKPYSDIDLCVITERNFSKDVKEEILSNSSRKIDISIFWDLPLNIRFRVIKEGRLLYQKDRLSLHRIKIDAIRAYLDFQPTLKRFCLNVLAR